MSEEATKQDGNGKPDPRKPVEIAKDLKLEEIDVLKYQLLAEKARNSQMHMEGLHNEMAGAQERARGIAKETTGLLDAMSKKYGIDFKVFTLDPDGNVVPRRMPVVSRA